MVIWSKPAGTSGPDAPDYWEYFGSRFVELAAVSPGISVLDVGCGTGSSMFPAAERVGTGGRVVGIDICEHSLGVTVSRIETQNMDTVSAFLMNAEDLDFPGGSFDLALCGFMGWDYCYDFVLGEFTGPDTRMQEIRRVLRDGGRVGFSVWERQEDIEWLEALFCWHIPSLASKTNPVRGVRRETVYSQENARDYVHLLRNAGFKEIEIASETVDCVNAGQEAKEAWWEQMRAVGWDNVFDQVSSLEPDRLQGFKEAVFIALERQMRVDGIHFAKSVSFVFATK